MSNAQDLSLGTAAYYDRLKLIYQSWRVQRMTSEGLRAGLGLCKIYPFNPETPIQLDKSISVTEHEVGVEDLAFQMLVSGLMHDVYSLPTVSKLPMIALAPLVARLHDHAERLLGGDVAQDGTRNDESADANELGVFSGMVASYYPEIADDLVRIFTEFVQRSTPLGQLIFCADKADEVLTALYLEERAIAAYVTDKDVMTESDLARADFARRFEYADVVMLHFLDCTNDFADVRQPFIGVIRLACEKTSRQRPEREPWFTWWEKYLLTH